MNTNIFRQLVVLICAITGSVISRKTIKSGWYTTAYLSNKQPPGYIFGIVWTFIYISYALIWKYTSEYIPLWLDILFLVNILLNLLWIYVFFQLGNIELSKIIIILLLCLTLFQAYMIFNIEDTRVVPNFSGVCVFGLLIYASWLIIATKLNFDTKKL